MNSHRTAIARKSLPAPTRWLISKGLITGHVLDFGCGKCKPLNDAILTKLPNVKSVTSYDPHWEPDTCMIPYFYDVVLCTYVLCTLPEEAVSNILYRIQLALRPTGVAYITVRNDEPKNGYGISSLGTYQRRVVLDYLLEKRKCALYRTYMLTSSTEIL